MSFGGEPAAIGGEAGEWEPAFLELGLTLKTMFRVISRRRGRETHLGETGISHAQFELLIELCEHGQLALGELAAAAGLAPATVTQMLGHLVAGGYVERVRSGVDRRVVVSRLTPAGLRLMEERRVVWRTRWEEALASFTPAEMRTAAQMLKALCAIFEDDHPTLAKR